MKSLFVLSLILVAALSFELTNVGETNWPFKSCGDGDFSVSKFTWEQTPTRGKKMSFTVVILLVFRVEQLKIILLSIKLALLCPSMVSQLMSLLMISRRPMQRELLSLILTTINYLRLQEAMETVLLSTTPKTIL